MIGELLQSPLIASGSTECTDDAQKRAEHGFRRMQIEIFEDQTWHIPLKTATRSLRGDWGLSREQLVNQGVWCQRITGNCVLYRIIICMIQTKNYVHKKKLVLSKCCGSFHNYIPRFQVISPHVEPSNIQYPVVLGIPITSFLPHSCQKKIKQSFIDIT